MYSILITSSDFSTNCFTSLKKPYTQLQVHVHLANPEGQFILCLLCDRSILTYTTTRRRAILFVVFKQHEKEKNVCITTSENRVKDFT